MIVEQETLKQSTIEMLKEEGFKLIVTEFRPTAENFSKYFYDKMKAQGYQVKCATVYETPKNSATYCEE